MLDVASVPNMNKALLVFSHTHVTFHWIHKISLVISSSTFISKYYGCGKHIGQIVVLFPKLGFRLSSARYLFCDFDRLKRQVNITKSGGKFVYFLCRLRDLRGLHPLDLGGNLGRSRRVRWVLVPRAFQPSKSCCHGPL